MKGRINDKGEYLGELRGHGLQGEGAAFEDYDRHPFGGGSEVEHRSRRVPGWEGFGLCSCGARSEELPSNKKRQAWHRRHKAEIWSEKDPWSTTPLSPLDMAILLRIKKAMLAHLNKHDQLVTKPSKAIDLTHDEAERLREVFALTERKTDG